MNKELNNQDKKKLNHDKIKSITSQFIDSLLTGLVGFIGVAIVINLLLMYIKINKAWVLPIIFFLALMISPFLPKFKVGFKILTWYENKINSFIRK
jgi:hypothetical protein